MADGDTNNGYFALSRKTFRHPEDGGCDWWHEPRRYSRWEAWVDLIQSAAFRPHRRTLGHGSFVDLRRGETPPRSVRYLALRWGWSRKRVERFLAEGSERDRFVSGQRTPKGDTYLIVNYDAYQLGGDSGETAVRQTRDSGETKKKKDKKSKKGKKGKDARAIPRVVTEAIPGFEELWETRMQSANEKRRKITPTGERQQLARIARWLEAGTPVADILELIEDATVGSWQGLKIEWLESRKNGRGRSAGRESTRGTIQARRDTTTEPSAEILGGGD